MPGRDPLDDLASIFADAEASAPVNSREHIEAFYARDTPKLEEDAALDSLASIFGGPQTENARENQALDDLVEAAAGDQPPARSIDTGTLGSPFGTQVIREAAPAEPGTAPAGAAIPPFRPEQAVPPSLQFHTPGAMAPREPPMQAIDDPALLERMARSAAEIEAYADPLFKAAPTDVSKLRRFNQILRSKGLPEAWELPKPEGLGQVLKEEFTTGKGLVGKIPYAGVASDIKDLYEVYTAVQRLEQGTATKADWETVADFQDEIAKGMRGHTFWGGAANIAAESIPFMGEMLTSGGLAVATRKVGRKALGEAAEKGAIKAVRNALTKLAARKGFSAAAGRGALAAAERIPFMSHRIAMGTIERMLPDYRVTPADAQTAAMIVDAPGAPFWQAFRDSSIDLSIEVISEMSGESLGVLVGGAGRAGRRAVRTLAPKAIAVPARRIGAFMAQARTSLIAELMEKYPGKYATYQAAANLLRKSGWHGVINEIGEERVGELMRQASVNIMEMADVETTMQPQEIPSARQLAQEFVAFAMPGVGAAAAGAMMPGDRERQVVDTLDREFEAPEPSPEQDVTDEWRTAVEEAQQPQPPQEQEVTDTPRTQPETIKARIKEPEPPKPPAEKPTKAVVTEPGTSRPPTAQGPEMVPIPTELTEGPGLAPPAQPLRGKITAAAQAAQAPSERVGDYTISMRPDGLWAAYNDDGDQVGPSNVDRDSVIAWAGRQMLEQEERGTDVPPSEERGTDVPPSTDKPVDGKDLDTPQGTPKQNRGIKSGIIRPDLRPDELVWWKGQEWEIKRVNDDGTVDLRRYRTEDNVPTMIESRMGVPIEDVSRSARKTEAPETPSAPETEAPENLVRGRIVDATGPPRPGALPGLEDAARDADVSSARRRLGSLVIARDVIENFDDAYDDEIEAAERTINTDPAILGDLPAWVGPDSPLAEDLEQLIETDDPDGYHVPRLLKRIKDEIARVEAILAEDEGAEPESETEKQDFTPEAPEGGTLQEEAPTDATTTQETPEDPGEGPGPEDEGSDRGGREPPPEDRGPGGQGPDVAGQAGEATPPGRQPRPVRAPAEGGGAEPAPMAEAGAGGGPAGGGGEVGGAVPAGRGAGDRGGAEPGAAADERDAGEASESFPSEEPADSVTSTAPVNQADADRDYVITASDKLLEDLQDREGHGTKTGARRNIAAIRLAKEIMAEQRPATDEEKAVLVGYMGWGSFRNIFDYNKREWADLRDELRELLTEDEYRAAEASSEAAMYTPPEIVRFIYRAAEHLGVRGGAMLEPGSGVGHFFGLMPAKLRSQMARVGVEADDMSVAIARLLYPQSRFEHGRYQKVALPSDYFTLAVGNPPFGKGRVHDPAIPAIGRPSLHSYFLSKAMSQLRPGGVMGMVVSHYFLDAADHTEYRKWLREQAELVGAFRLYSGAMPGTSVVVDLVFFRKRLPGERPTEHEPKWIESVKGFEGIDAYVNEFFTDDPARVLGTMGRADALGRRALYNPGEMVVVNKSNKKLASFLTEALEELPEGVAGQVAEAASEALDEMVDRLTASPENLPVGSYFVADDKLWQVGEQADQPRFVEPAMRKERGGAKRVETFKALVRMRDLVMQMIRNSAAGDSIEAPQAELNAAYDAFVKKHKSVIGTMAYKQMAKADYHSGAMLALLEQKPGEKGHVLKGEIAVRRARPTSAESTADAVAISMAEHAAIDPAYVAELLKTTEAQAIERMVNERLAFESPDGRIVEASEYLSGHVRQKYAEAERAARLDDRFEPNVRALAGVIPKDHPPGQADARLGAPWVTQAMYEDFTHKTFGSGIELHYIGATATWVLKNKGAANAAANEHWGTRDYDGIRVLEAALNQRTITVKVTYTEGGKKYTRIDAAQTEVARQKAVQLHDEFKRWLWESKHAEEASRIFNWEYNSLVPRTFDGSHYRAGGINGMSPGYRPYPYQADAIWRIVAGGNTVLDVHVGGGKTLILTAASQELQRLGTSRRTLIVIDNRTAAGFPRLAREYFPGGNFLYLDANKVGARERRQVFARIATDPRPLTVIIPHHLLPKIPLGQAALDEFYGEQIAELKAALAEAEELDEGKMGPGYRKRKKSPTVRQLSEMIRKLEESLAAKTESLAREKGLTFEEMGFDWIMYDESQAVKNLAFHSKMAQNVRGLGNRTGSDRALDFYMKSRIIQRLQNGRGVVLSSGTPIANSMAEIFHIMRYVLYDQLQARGMVSFDAWASNFAVPEQRLDRTVEMENKNETALRRFINLPALYNLWSQVAHTVTLEDMREYIDRGENRIPKVATNPDGKRDWETIVLPRGDLADRLYNWVTERGRKIRDTLRAQRGVTKKGDDTFGAIATDGRKASVDFRLVFEGVKDDENKLDRAVDEIVEIYQAGHEPRTNSLGQTFDRTLQVVAIDFISGRKTTFNAHDHVRAQLRDRGIPDAEIGMLSEVSGDKAKEALLARARKGEIRVLISTIGKIGVGVNVQDRLEAIHLLSPPYTPDQVTQLIGRAIRQGNKNDEVRLIRYAREGTFDEWNYGMLFRKAYAIDQWRIAGPKGQWELEWPDEGTISFGELEAALADNPYIRDANTAQLEAKRLEYLFNDAQRQEVNNRARKAQLDRDLPDLERKAQRSQAALDSLGETTTTSLVVAADTPLRLDAKEPKHASAGTALTKPGEIGRAVWYQLLAHREDKGFHGTWYDVGTVGDGRGTVEARKFEGQLYVRVRWEFDTVTPITQRFWPAILDVADSIEVSQSGKMNALTVSLGQDVLGSAGQVRAAAAHATSQLEEARSDYERVKDYRSAESEALAEQLRLAKEKARRLELLAQHYGDGPVKPGQVVEVKNAGEHGETIRLTIKAIGERDDGTLTVTVQRDKDAAPEEWDATYFTESTGYQVELPEGAEAGGGTGEMPPAAPGVRGRITDFAPYPKELSHEQKQWIRDHADRPSFGMGAMFNMPDPRTNWQRLWDRYAEKFSNSDSRVAKWFGRGLYGARFGLDRGAWEGLRTYQGKMGRSRRDVDKLLIQLGDLYRWWEKKAPAEEKKAVAIKRTERDDEGNLVEVTDYTTDANEMLKAAAEGNAKVEDLPAPVRRVYDVARDKVREIVEEFVEDEELHTYAEAFGLTNVMDIIKSKFDSPGHYLRMVIGNPPDREYSPARKIIETRKIPPVKGGMYKPRGSMRETWTVTNADGSATQFSDEDSAWEHAYREIAENRGYYGESVLERVTVQDPYGEEELLVAGREPEMDYRRRLARTIVDLRHNLEILKFYRMLNQTLSWEPNTDLEETWRDKPAGYRRLGNSPTWGPLAGAALPENLIDVLKEVRITRTGLVGQLWDLYTYAWKTAKTVYSLGTRARDFFGGWYFASLAGMTPKDLRHYRSAVRDLVDPDNSEAYQVLLDNNQILGGFAHVDLREMEDRIFARGKRARTLRWHQFMELFEAIVRKHRKIANTYDLFDQLHKLAFYHKAIEELGWDETETIDAISGQFPNYAESGDWSERVTKSWWGTPFYRFVEATMRVNLYHARNHPLRLMLVNSMPGLLTLTTALLLGIDDEELMLISNADPRRRRWSDRYFMPLLPFRDADTGRLLQLDLRWMWPGANDFRATTGAGGIGLPWILNHPVTKSVINTMWNKNDYTGFQLYDPDDSLPEKALASVKEAAGNLVPLPSTLTRGIPELIEALTTDERKIPFVIAKHVFGLRIESPRLSRNQALEAIRDTYGEAGADAAIRMMDVFNETYLRAHQRPITERGLEQSIIRARIRDAD